MDEPTRRAWSKPELIVLVRGGPEEAVLTGCKLVAGSSGSGNRNSSCSYPTCDVPCFSGYGS